MLPARRPTIAVFKFSSCDGCQLSILNLEEELLDLVGAVDIAYFLEARSRMAPGPYDLALVEGSITTEEEARRIREIRAQARVLVALGTCATSGGIQALRNFADVAEYAQEVYPHAEYIRALRTSTPVAEHVPVDMELWGCPISRELLLEATTAFLHGRRPVLPQHAVCLDCKRRGAVCVLVAAGEPCLGPITQAGCGALCPASGRGCYGCFGPLAGADPARLVPTLRTLEKSPGETVRLLRHISGGAPAFRQAADAILEEARR